MGRAWLSPRAAVSLLIAAGCVLVAVGVGILAGIGWALLAGGALTIAYALVMVDLPDRAARERARAGAPTRPISVPTRRAEGG